MYGLSPEQTYPGCSLRDLLEYCYLVEALRHAPTALAGARRLPVEIVAPYDPSTGRIGYMDQLQSRPLKRA